jgi:hypothetical protein
MHSLQEEFSVHAVLLSRIVTSFMLASISLFVPKLLKVAFRRSDYKVSGNLDHPFREGLQEIESLGGSCSLC